MSEFLEKEKTKEVLDFLAKKIEAKKFILIDPMNNSMNEADDQMNKARDKKILGVKWPLLVYDGPSPIVGGKYPYFVYGKSLEKCLENMLKMSCDEKCSFYVRKWNNQKRLYGRIVVVPPNSCLESLLIERDLSGL